MSINKVLLTGNLTREPELRCTSSGTPVLVFGVAVNERRKTQAGDWKDYANFIDCTMFGTRAENVASFISKGSKVAIEGKLHYSKWEHNGTTRSKIEVIIDNIELLSQANIRTGEYDIANGYHIVDNMSQGQIYDEDVPF